MSLLDSVTTPQFSITQRKANRLINSPSQLFNQILTQWSQGVSDIWDDANPQAVLDAIGTHAAELFDLSAKTAAFIEELKPGSTAPVLAKLKEFTVNADGTITIKTPPPTTPAPQS